MQKNVANSEKSGIIKNEDVFHCYGDYLRKKMGSAIKNNYDDFCKIKSEVEKQGGKIVLLKNNTKMVCNISKGTPGIIEVDENISIAGLMHEYRHFLDDMENGNPGLAFYLQDNDRFFDYEKRGYEEELSIAKTLGFNDETKQILYEIEKRRQEIYAE